MKLVSKSQYVVPFLDRSFKMLKITMEIKQQIFFQVRWLCKDLPFVRRHRIRIGVEKAVYKSTQIAVFVFSLILLFELLPANTARTLSSEAYVNKNPEKRLEIMNGVVESSTRMTAKRVPQA